MTAPSAATSAPPEATATRPPKPWLAALLSLVPGMGHLYAGHPWPALLAWLLAWSVGVLAIAGVVWGSAGALALAFAVLAALAVRVAIAVSAYRTAARQMPVLSARGWRVAALCLLFFFAVSRLEEETLSWLKAHWVEAFRIPSEAMAPTILNGDYLITTAVRAHEPVHRGELVVYRYAPTIQFVKRVVGLAGDTLSMEAGRLYLNARPVAEPYARADSVAGDAGAEEFSWQRRALVAGADSAHYQPSRRNWGPLVVPPDSIFVLGDNRDNSLDSRYTGFVARRDVSRRPLSIYWSREPGGAVRWGRIGRLLD